MTVSDLSRIELEIEYDNPPEASSSASLTMANTSEEGAKPTAEK
jgi:hypothetical protein